MIHFHGAPVSGPRDNAHRFYSGRHVMVSYANPECLPVVASVCKTFALDNGAFTTWKQGKKFDLEGYYDWVREWRDHPSFAWAAIPDVIDGTQRENDKLIGSWPLRLRDGMAVWHLHERIDKLCALLNWRGQAALGSSGQWATPGNSAWWDRIAEVMPRICTENGQPYGKLHGLRMLDPEIFARIPLHSADSCNASINAGSVSRFGMYVPPEAAGRANVIADRIESMPSADRWRKPDVTASMFELTLVGSTP